MQQKRLTTEISQTYGRDYRHVHHVTDALTPLAKLRHLIDALNRNKKQQHKMLPFLYNFFLDFFPHAFGLGTHSTVHKATTSPFHFQYVVN